MPVEITHICETCGCREKYPPSRMGPVQLVQRFDVTLTHNLGFMCEDCWLAVLAAATGALEERKSHAGQAVSD